MEKDNNTDLIKGLYTHASAAPAARTRELDGNEKAATFIGWNPDDPCIGGMLSNDGYCIHGNYGACDQFQAAPDMRIPNNYMAALLVLDNFEVQKDEELYTVYVDDGRIRLMKLHDDLATCVIQVLAQLHDRRIQLNGR